MTNRNLVAVAFAFLLGVVLSPVFVPTAQASGDGWTFKQITRALDLLEQIAANTEK